MWILSCETDLLGGKCIWLRPGSQHLLGRTTGRSADEQLQYIDHKSISRKHLLIKVEPLPPGASSKLHTRSEISLEDSSKSGTFVNDEKLSKAKRVIDKTNTKIQLGSSNYVFNITWRPVVLTFTNLSSAEKKQQDPLQEYRAKFEHADIKLITTYISGTTTHVVATGRNNPSCLQALAQARWVVQYSWLTKLAEIVKIESMEVTKTPLESDFVAEWPHETQYVVPSTTEPTPRPDEMMLPDKRRAEVLSGLTFVFEAEKQYSTLMPAIAAAGGKALLKEVVAEETEVDAYVDMVKEHVATKKAGATIDDMNQIVIVRAEPKEDAQWWATFNEDVQGTLGQRCISQVEFLDAILTLDARSLCQSVPTTRPAQSLPESAAPTQTSSKARRYAAQSRFKGFDDFDPSQVVRIDSSPEPAQASAEPMEITQPSRKRPAPVADLQGILDQQVSSVREIKRLRLAKSPSPVPVEAPAKKDRLPDVKTKLAEQRKKEEEERARQEQELDHQLDGLTFEDLQSFVQHEEFEIVLPQATETYDSPQDRPGWDPAWTGRKNFKAFRPQGQQDRGARQQRVMVALEPLPLKTDAFFDEYFLNSGDTPREPVPVSERQSNSLGLSSYGSAQTRQSQVAGVLSGQKRPLTEQSTNDTVAKRPRRAPAISLDDDSDDELQFRRKRF